MNKEKYTHSGMVETVHEGKRRTPLYKSGTYWVSENGLKFDHNGNSFGSTWARLNLKSIKSIK